MSLEYIVAMGLGFFLLFEAIWYYLGILLSKVEKKRGFQKISLEQWEKDVKNLSCKLVSYGEIKIPERATAKSGGYDIFSTVEIELKPGEDVNIPTGIKCYMLDDEKLEISPRSGLGFKYYLRLANTVGKIDSDYYNSPETEGHIRVKVRNEGKNTVLIRKGDAIAQGSFEKYLLVDGDSFTGKKRVGGFGSTSRK